MNFFLNRNKDKFKAREAQEIRDNFGKIELVWDNLYEETMPILRKNINCFELEQCVKIVLTEANQQDIERKRKKWEILYTNL